MVAVGAVVAQQGRGSVQVVHDHVHVAVVVEVAERAPPAEVLGEDRRPRPGGDVLESSVPQVAIEHPRLAVLEVEVLLRDLGVHVAVHEEDVGPPVVVEVEEVDAEAEVLPVHAEAGPEAHLLEGAAVVAVECRHLLGEVRADDVQPAVAVEVAHADSHSRQRGSLPVEGAARGNRHLPEGPVLVVAIEEARRGVAGHVDVGPAVVVEIRRRRSHAVGAGGLPVAADEDHGGGPAIEHVRAPCESERSAGDRDVVVATVGGLSRPRGRGGVEVQVAGDEQVQVPVTVVVQEAAPGAPPVRRTGDPRALRDVRERPVAVVVVEDALSPVGDEEVVVAVVVVVADAAALSPAGMREARLLGDVGERAVAVVVEEVAPGPAVADSGVEARAVHEEDVEPAVVVVVEERGAASHLLQDELLVVRAAGDVRGVQEAGGGGDVREDDRTRDLGEERPRPAPPWQESRPHGPSHRPQEAATGGPAGVAPPHAPPLGAAAFLRCSRRIFSSSFASRSRRLKESRAFRLSSALPSRR